MSKPYSSAMKLDGVEDFPPIRNGASGGESHRGGGGGSRGARNKNKNTRGRNGNYKVNGGGQRSKEPTPNLPEETENDKEPLQTDRADDKEVTPTPPPIVKSPEPRLDTTEDHFVTANNSAEETHNGNSGPFSKANLADFSEDIVNSNTPRASTYTPNNSTIHDSFVTQKNVNFRAVERNRDGDMSFMNAGEEDDDLSNASLIVQMSDTACDDNLDVQSFTFPSHEASSLLSSPLSSSRSAPPDLSIQDQGEISLQTGDSIIYPTHPTKFQTSTPISSNASSRHSDGGSGDCTMNITTGGAGPVGGWDSTIYGEDPSNVMKANTGFRVDGDDSSHQISGLGFTREESGICADMCTPTPLNEGNGNLSIDNEIHHKVEKTVREEAELEHNASKSNTDLEEANDGFIQKSPETQAQVQVPNANVTSPPTESKTVTFQDPLHQEELLSDADEEVEEINKPFMLPSTVTELTTPNGVKVYIVGTAHFSRESQLDVIQTIQKVQPTVVLLELCHSRSGMLAMNEEQIMKEAADMSLEKIRSTIRQSGPIQGSLHLLLLSMTATLTKKLGMAPGGEFRVALQEAKKVPGCGVHLGDRNLAVTLNRALSGLSVYQKMKLAWHFLLNDTDITKEEVEACKQKDLLEKLLLEMAGEFPSITRVLLDERDLYLAHSLWLAATSIRMDRYGHTEPTEGPIVGVVGMGHVAGIVKNWGKVSEEQIAEIMQIPEPHISSVIMGKAVKYGFYLLVGYGVYKGSRKLFGFPSNSLIESVVGSTTSALQNITSGRLTGI